MKQSESYDRSIHRTGRLGSILAIAWMLGIPAVMCTVYHMFPSIPDLLLFGSGLLALAEKLGLRRDQVMAVGDSGNDLSMIEDAGLGVAMGNADERVKRAADRTAPSNNEDGIAQVLEGLFPPPDPSA